MSYNLGDIVLVKVPFTNQKEYKLRPAFVWFEEYSNVVILGITSNTQMKGIFIPKEIGLIVDSVIKTNYIFTIDKNDIQKKLITLPQKYIQKVCKELNLKCKEQK
jgi:mRNA-degrading endonuclease toxin of MazEF toxin-antitoxin module